MFLSRFVFHVNLFVIWDNKRSTSFFFVYFIKKKKNEKAFKFGQMKLS